MEGLEELYLQLLAHALPDLEGAQQRGLGVRRRAVRKATVLILTLLTPSYTLIVQAV